jgi:hypothetical protein
MLAGIERRDGEPRVARRIGGNEDGFERIVLD